MTESRRQEEDIARHLGGLRTPASGAFWHRKGDVVTPLWMIEAKQTNRKSISISLSVWEKIRREALLTGKIPLLALRLQKRDLVVMDLEDFLALFPESEGDLEQGGVP